MPPPPRYLSALDLRYNFPKVRKELEDGAHYIVLYRGKPVAELKAPSGDVLSGFFANTTPLSPGARIKKNVAKRKKKRMKRGNEY